MFIFSNFDFKCTMDCPAHQTYQFNHGHTEETCEGFRQVAAEGQTTEGKISTIFFQIPRLQIKFIFVGLPKWNLVN